MAFPNDGNKFKPGVSGNPAGKPKGSIHLSRLIQELADIDWELTNLKNKEELKEKYGKKGWTALVHVAFSKAMSGDVKAMEWLAKHGYGEKLRVEIDDPRKEILDKYLGGDDAGEAKKATDRPSKDTA